MAKPGGSATKKQTTKRAAPKSPGSRAPKELQALLRIDAGAREAWESMTAARRTLWVQRIAEADKPESRARRLEKLIALLVHPDD